MLLSKFKLFFLTRFSFHTAHVCPQAKKSDYKATLTQSEFSSLLRKHRLSFYTQVLLHWDINLLYLERRFYSTASSGIYKYNFQETQMSFNVVLSK